jgi:hypothetical protein
MIGHNYYLVLTALDLTDTFNRVIFQGLQARPTYLIGSAFMATPVIDEGLNIYLLYYHLRGKLL